MGNRGPKASSCGQPKTDQTMQADLSVCWACMSSCELPSLKLILTREMDKVEDGGRWIFDGNLGIIFYVSP